MKPAVMKPGIPDDANAWSSGYLPGLFGIEIVTLKEGLVHARLPVVEEHLSPNGFLHAATVIALADTACGYGAMASVPQGATGFTTIELKANFMGTVSHDTVLECEAVMQHGGLSTQVWDATVTNSENGKTIALFRCTQLVLHR